MTKNKSSNVGVQDFVNPVALFNLGYNFGYHKLGPALQKRRQKGLSSGQPSVIDLKVPEIKSGPRIGSSELFVQGYNTSFVQTNIGDKVLYQVHNFTTEVQTKFSGVEKHSVRYKDSLLDLHLNSDTDWIGWLCLIVSPTNIFAGSNTVSYNGPASGNLQEYIGAAVADDAKIIPIARIIPRKFFPHASSVEHYRADFKYQMKHLFNAAAKLIDKAEFDGDSIPFISLAMFNWMMKASVQTINVRGRSIQSYDFPPRN